MARYEYKTVDTRSLKGLKQAERLHAAGWKMISGADVIQFERKIEYAYGIKRNGKYGLIRIS